MTPSSTATRIETARSHHPPLPCTPRHWPCSTINSPEPWGNTPSTLMDRSRSDTSASIDMLRIEDALRVIPAEDRETWIRIGMAIQHELGDEGFDLWDNWSKTAESYNERVAKHMWRSFSPNGGITIGTLYALAKQHGWKPTQRYAPPSPEKLERKKRDREKEEKRRARKSEIAAIQVLHILPNLSIPPNGHPYLKAKGLAGRVHSHVWYHGPERPYLCLSRGDLVIPLKRKRNGPIVSAQIIKPDGEKRFVPGGRVRGSYHALKFQSDSRVIALCEGFATAWTLALTRRFKYILACMSAANLSVVAQSIRERDDWTFISVADRDKNGIGEKYARHAGLPYWLPPETGDANDLMMRHGITSVCAAADPNGWRRKLPVDA